VVIEMSMEELLALPVSMDIVTAGRAFGFGKNKSRELARTDEFPCAVKRFGGKYLVTRTALFGALGITEPQADAS
jgi:hypothetical protein